MKEEKNNLSSREKLKLFYRYTKNYFNFFRSILQLIVNLAIIAGVVFAFIQVEDYRIRTSADLVLKFGEYLDDGIYLEISQALDTEDKTLKVFQPEGLFKTGDIDRYLGTFETLGNLYKRGLITCDMFSTNFAYYIKKAYFNEEARSYINEVNDEGQKWWPNLVLLGDTFVYGKNIDCGE